MEPGRLGASAVASYLRSALSSASGSTKHAPEQAAAAALSSSDVSTAPSSDEDEHKSGAAADAVATDLDALHMHADSDTADTAAGNDASDCIDTLGAADGSSSPHTAYLVTYDLPHENTESCVDSDDNSIPFDQISSATAKQSQPQLQYIDVLLQPDDHGLGLNIKAASRTSETHDANPSSHDTVLVVESFRHLHAHDIGPAEASQQIQRGDILHSIDGNRLRDLEQLVATVKAHTRSTSEDSPFVLLRFLRTVQDIETTSLDAATLNERSRVPTERQTDAHSPTEQERGKPTLAAAWLTDPQHVTLLVRELAATNERLQQELVASKLAQEEQRIHLEQLYALYAKTQLERTSTLSLPMASRLRFPRRASTKQQHGSGSTGPPSTVIPTMANATASSTVSTTTEALHTELELAVRTEHERLQTHYDLQRRTEVRELTEQHAKELAHVRETMAKKLAMLTRGFDDALASARAQFEAQLQEQAERSSANSSGSSMETCSCGTWMRLQQELSIHQSLEHGGSSSSGSGDTVECLVCALLTDARRNARADSPTASSSSSRSSEADDVASQRIACVRALLSEYDGLKHERSERWRALELGPAKQAEPEQQP